MAEYLTNTEDMKIVADAIRAKGSTSDPLTFPQGMADAVSAISGGGGEVEKMLEAIVSRADNANIDISCCTSVGVDVFNGWSGLVSFKSPSVEIIAKQAFRNTGVVNVQLPGLVSINGFRAFAYNNNLQKVDIGSQFNGFNENNIFDNCPALTTVIIRSSNVAWLNSTSVFSKTPISTGTGFIYVPKNLVEQYKAATNWVTYATQIRAIEDYPDITGGV